MGINRSMRNHRYPRQSAFQGSRDSITGISGQKNESVRLFHGAPLDHRAFRGAEL
jgi:hypothetical protein